MAKKIAIVAGLMCVYMFAGGLERGYIDWLGAAALMALVIPMTVTWIKEGGKDE